MKTFVTACAFSLALVACGGGGGDGGDDRGSPPPDVSGTWVEDQAQLVSSDCAPELDERLRALIDPTGVCAYQISQSGNRVTVTDCGGTVLRGSVNEAGVVTADTTVTASEQGCSVSLRLNLAADLSHSPTVGRFTVSFRFSGCGLSNCTAVVETRWTR